MRSRRLSTLAQRAGLVAIFGGLSLLTVACGDDDDAQTTAIPATATNAQTRPAEPSATATASVVPTKAPPATPTVHPDRAALEPIVAAVTSGDSAKVRALLTLAQVGCITVPQGIGGPPLCPSGTAAGTKIEVFPSSVCEQEWVFPNLIEGAVTSRVVAGRPELYAIYRRGPATGLFPSGSIVAVFRDREASPGRQAGAGKAVTIENGSIISSVFGCDRKPAELLGDPGGRTWIVEPAP